MAYGLLDTGFVDKPLEVIIEGGLALVALGEALEGVASGTGMHPAKPAACQGAGCSERLYAAHFRYD